MVRAMVKQPDPVNLGAETSSDAIQFRLQTLASKLGPIFFGQELFQSPPRLRERYSQAFLEIIAFLFESGVHPMVMNELKEFIDGLNELNQGTVRHFLRPEALKSRPIDPNDIWLARAYLAMALDELIRGGSTRKAAARDIAKKTHRLSYALSKPGGDYAGALESWHISFMRGNVMRKGAQGAFDDRQRYVGMYRAKLQGRVDQNLVEGCIVSSLLRDATVAAMRASDTDALKRVKTARKKSPSKISGR